ncbi:Predicted Zn-dependent protease [Jatrophihabitans endophyticus]|uniref:Predicted Zn-dependent protease n=2 Tax=Jatrophihabitans endophyticus TaxID=1206085 RepID=A0A1M5U6M0_9ACTN|nr:Predicted Zn-dependent protease [Jatrophihabitans endophyticus]
MQRVLDAPEDARRNAVRALWQPMAAMYRFAPAALDLADVHSSSFGFDWRTTDPVVGRALDLLDTADAWARLEQALALGSAALERATAVDDLTVLLVLGNPSDRHFMDELQGLSAFGGISGYITITLWPTPTVLQRLEAIAVHELHHNVRYSPSGVLWNPATVDVGEQVVAEGLADVFAAELFGDLGWTHFVAESTRADRAVLAKVVSGAGMTGMQNFTAWVHGDASARRFGVEPVGLPTGAGYAAGAQLVTAYLERAGGTAAEHVHTPSASVLETGCRALGLPRPS